MSDNIVEITNDSSPQYSIEVSTSLEANDNNVTIELANSSNVNVDIINNTTVLVSDLPQGYPLDWTVGTLPVTRVSGLVGQSGINYTSGIISLSGIPSKFLPVQNLIAGSGISISSNNGIFNISVTGQFGLTGEQVDDRINNLLVAGSYVDLDYNDLTDSLTVSVTGLQPSGNYSVIGHSHNSSDINDFNTSVDQRISLANLQPSGNYSLVGHNHVLSDISGLQLTLDSKAPIFNPVFSGTVSGITKDMVGLGDVDNTSDLNKPISNAVQIALNNKSDINHTHGNITSSGTIGAYGDKILITDANKVIIDYDYAPKSHTLYDPANSWDILSFTDTTPVWSPEAILNDTHIQLRDSIFASPLLHSHGNLSSSGTIGSTSGLLVIAGSGGVLTTTSGINSSLITNFNTAVSGLINGIYAPLNSPTFTGNVAGISKTMVGLGNVDNTSDSDKPISNATQIALNNKAALSHTHSSSDITNFNSSVSGLISGIYQPLLTNPVTGTGTIGYLSRFGSTSVLNNSIVFQSGAGIGINTTTPSGYLDIAGDVYVRGTGNNFGTIYLKSSAVADDILKLRADQFGSLFLEAGNSPYLKLGNQDGVADLRAGASQLTIGHSYARGGAGAVNQYISFNPSNTERVRITNVGDVGIGTTAPSGKLDLVGDAYIRGSTYYTTSATDTTTSCRIYSVTSGENRLHLTGGSNSISLWGNAGKLILLSSSVGTEIGSTFPNSYVMFNPGGGSEKARITPAGSMGIGTSTPSGQLHVIGTGIISSQLGVGVNNPLDLVHISGSSANGQGIRLENADGYGGSILADNGALYLNSSTATVCRIQSSKIRLGDGVSSCAIELTANGSISQNGNGGGLTFNGTTGQFSNGLNITAGNVGIGTSSPSGQLHVVGSGIFASGLFVNTTPVSVSGHSHTSSDISNFNSSVSGLLPVTNITAGTNISITNNSGNFTINSTAAGGGGGATISNSGLNRLLTSDGSTSGIVGQENMTFNGSLLNVNGSGNFNSGIFISGVPLGEIIDDEVAGLLVAGSGINLTYNDSANTLTVDTNVSTSLIAGTGISLAYNSITDELSIQANTNVINSSNLYLWSNFR